MLGTTACTVRPEQASIDGQDVEMVVLHTSDIHSRLLPYNMDIMLTDQKQGLAEQNAPFGGMARLAAVVKQQRRDHSRVLYLETGDVFQGAPIFNSFGGEPEFKAMTQLQVDAFAIGNHEFDNGTSHFVEQALTHASFPMVAANYAIGDPDFDKHVKSGKVASPYTIINANGLRVGVIGLGYVGGSAKKRVGSSGVVSIRHRDTVQYYVDFLRPVVDLVVVASHAGYHDDQEMIPRTEGVDIWLGGHLHIFLDPPAVLQDCDIVKLKRERDRYRCNTPEKIDAAQRNCKRSCEGKQGAALTQCNNDCLKEARDSCEREARERRYDQRIEELNSDIAFLEQRGCHPRDVILMHSGAFLKYIGKLQVTLRQCHRIKGDVCLERDAWGVCVRKTPRRCVGSGTARNDWEVLAHDYTLIPVDKRLPEDPQMLYLLEPYILELHRQQQLTEVLGYTPRRIYRFSKGTGDSEVGNMLTEAMMTRSQVWADLAVTNSLGVRQDIVAGPVVAEQMTNVFPFENSITVMYLSGTELQAMFDFISQRSASRGCQSQAQISGATFTMNCAGCPAKGGNSCIRQPYDGAACAQRVTVGGSGKECATDADCTGGEICTRQLHPDPGAAIRNKPYRCWRPLVCDKTYRLAANDYIAHGGSGYRVLATNTTHVDLDISLRRTAIDFIRGMPACSQVPRTHDQKIKQAPVDYVLDKKDRARLQEMEAAANAGDINGADAAFGALMARLQQDLNEAKTQIATASGAKKVQLIQKRRGLENYLGCTKVAPESDSSCLGVACWQISMCHKFKPREMRKCEVLGKVRAALSCMSMPCITAKEDGRIQRIFRDAAGPPHVDPDYPG